MTRFDLRTLAQKILDENLDKRPRGEERTAALEKFLRFVYFMGRAQIPLKARESDSTSEAPINGEAREADTLSMFEEPK